MGCCSNQLDQFWGCFKQVADFSGAPYAGLGCTEREELHKSCQYEEVDGVVYKKCTELHKKFRQCQGRPEEKLLEKTTVTSQPYHPGSEQPSVSYSQSPVFSEREQGSNSLFNGQSPLPSGVGQMFDDFFDLAAEIERNMTGNGPQPLHPNIPEQYQTQRQEAHPPSFFSRLFGKRPQQTLKQGRSMADAKNESQIFAPFAYPQQSI